MRRVLFLAFLISLTLALSACKSQPSKPQTSAPQGPPWSGKMELTTVPSPPVSGKDTNFQLKLSDAAGNPVPAADVKAALVMPSMDMGKNEVTLADKGDGKYEGTGKFTMSGPWNVVVTAKAQGKSGQQTFPVVVHRE